MRTSDIHVGDTVEVVHGPRKVQYKGYWGLVDRVQPISIGSLVSVEFPGAAPDHGWFVSEELEVVRV